MARPALTVLVAMAAALASVSVCSAAPPLPEKTFDDVLRDSVATHLGAFPLYDGAIPNSKNAPDKETRQTWLNMELRLNVSRPTYTVYPAPPSRATHAAVVIFPGGGYSTLTWDAEGRWVAQSLQDRGVTAILVKYRLPSDETMIDKTIGPLQDAQQAILQVRKHAQTWSVDPRRIGAIGFSAGGHLVSMLGTQFHKPLVPDPDHVSLRPDFLILVYPVISFAQGRVTPDMRRALIGSAPSESTVESVSSSVHVSAQTPPTLLLAATNDSQVSVDHSIDFYRALREHHVAAELVLFERGEHGFFELARDDWMVPLWMWMRRNGYVDRP